MNWRLKKGCLQNIKAIRNEDLHSLSKRDKIARQITENSLRTNVSVYGNYLLARDEISENPQITVRDLSQRLKIKKDLAASFINLLTQIKLGANMKNIGSNPVQANIDLYLIEKLTDLEIKIKSSRKMLDVHIKPAIIRMALSQWMYADRRLFINK